MRGEYWFKVGVLAVVMAIAVMVADFEDPLVVWLLTIFMLLVVIRAVELYGADVNEQLIRSVFSSRSQEIAIYVRYTPWVREHLSIEQQLMERLKPVAERGAPSAEQLLRRFPHTVRAPHPFTRLAFDVILFVTGTAIGIIIPRVI